MKLRSDADIPERKITEYLLTPRPKNDKARFFAQAGYMRGAWQLLERDLRAQILPLDAELARSTPYGELYTITGVLKGPNGVELHILSVWMVEIDGMTTRLITVYPGRPEQ
jgi:hypothetical protein